MVGSVLLAGAKTRVVLGRHSHAGWVRKNFLGKNARINILAWACLSSRTETTVPPTLIAAANRLG